MLESTYVQRQIASFITGLAVKGINIGELRRILVPIVSRSEQDELVKEIDEVRTRQAAVAERLSANAAIKRLISEEGFDLNT